MREQVIERREAAVAEAEAAVRSMESALQGRYREAALHAQALEDREAALCKRENQSSPAEHVEAVDAPAFANLGVRNFELREANEKLVLATLAAEELRESAQTSERLQNEFLAMLSHELRNPMAPIRNTVELLSRLDGKPIPSHLLDIIRRQVQNMVRLVDDLLDVARVTQGKVVLQRRPVLVSEFVQGAVETSSDLIAARRQVLTLDLPRHDIYVDGDPVRLTQIFSNLLHNSAKYTPEGGAITLRAQRHGDFVDIQVIDNGTGISAEALPRIFDLFVQDDRALSRASGGLGIGLTVVRRMVQLHGGQVKAHSGGLGKGSEFTVTLPCVEHASTYGAPRAVAALAPAAASVLVVEDNVDAAETLALLLRSSGHHVDVAFDGPSGLDLFQKTKPGVVLCDIGLPGMDGYEAVARMREGKHDPRPVMIALTGYGGAHNADRALKAGFDRHVVKPIDFEVLLRLIESELRVQQWSNSRLSR